jgi:hypothetical protein
LALSGGCRKPCSRLIAAGAATFSFFLGAVLCAACPAARPAIVIGKVAQTAKLRTAHRIALSTLIASPPHAREETCKIRGISPNEVIYNRKNLKQLASVCQSNSSPGASRNHRRGTNDRGMEEGCHAIHVREPREMSWPAFLAIKHLLAENGDTNRTQGQRSPGFTWDLKG